MKKIVYVLAVAISVIAMISIAYGEEGVSNEGDTGHIAPDEHKNPAPPTVEELKASKIAGKNKSAPTDSPLAPIIEANTDVKELSYANPQELAIATEDQTVAPNNAKDVVEPLFATETELETAKIKQKDKPALVEIPLEFLSDSAIQPPLPASSLSNLNNVKKGISSTESVPLEMIAGIIPPSPTPLDDAVDHPGLELITGGGSNWFIQTSTYVYGGSAARSGYISHNQNTYMYTSDYLDTPQTVSFFWAVSSEANYDYLEFWIDSTRMDRISGSVGWQKKSFYVPAGFHTLYWRYIKDGSVNVGSDTGYLDNVQLLLDDAVDYPKLDLVTGGSSKWFVQDIAYSYGGDAAKSGIITHNQNTYMYTTKYQYTPQIVSFFWAVSSEANYDYLEFWIDSTRMARISGSIGWHKKSFIVPAGRHTLYWRYIKDGSVNIGADAGYVDNVQWLLDDAVDYEGLGLITGGSSNWRGQTSTYYHGGDAAKSGAITHNQNTYMYTTKYFSKPRLVSFKWAVSSEADYDYLEFYLDGTRKDRISGYVGWEPRNYIVPAGTHTLYWIYIKDDSVNVGADAGYVDDVLI